MRDQDRIIGATFRHRRNAQRGLGRCPRMATRWIPQFLRRGRGAPSGTGREATDLELVGLAEDDRETIRRSLNYTMTGVMRLRAVIDAVRHCVDTEVPGAFAECGVWRGGSVLAMISTLQAVGVEDRDIYLYDTFEGMTEPSEHDVSELDPPAIETWRESERDGDRAWSELFDEASFNEDAVRSLLESSGYPAERLHFVRGPVEQTLPANAPDQIALLRLDTDWYESTLHEMQHLYPRLSTGGVLIIDDYGHWQGARQAVDEYLDGVEARPLLTAIDYTARLAVKR
jgi:hypothetical protein